MRVQWVLKVSKANLVSLARVAHPGHPARLEPMDRMGPTGLKDLTVNLDPKAIPAWRVTLDLKAPVGIAVPKAMLATRVPAASRDHRVALAFRAPEASTREKMHAAPAGSLALNFHSVSENSRASGLCARGIGLLYFIKSHDCSVHRHT